MAIWTAVSGGEYNEHQATINGWDVHVYSDRDEEEWSYTLDDGDYKSLDADNLDDALSEAENETKGFAGYKKK